MKYPKQFRRLCAITMACATLSAGAQTPNSAPTRPTVAPLAAKPRVAASAVAQAPGVRTPLTAAELQAIEASPALNRIRSQQKMVVAFSKTASPFSVADTDGSAKGFAIDLCTKLAIAIQKQFRLSDLRTEYISPPFAERLQAVREGKADMECGNTIANAERKQTLGFSLPVYLTVSKLLVRSDSPANSLSALRGKQVVTTANSSSERIFKSINEKFLVGAQLVTRKTAAEAFSALSRSEADAFFMSDIVLSDMLASTPDADKYRMLRDAYSVDGIAIVLPKNDAGMKILVDRELKRIMSDDEIGKLYSKWFASPIPPNGVNLNLRINQLTRDHYKRPADDVVHANLF